MTIIGYFGGSATSLTIVLVLIPAIAPLFNNYTGVIPSSSELFTNIQTNYITQAGQTLNAFWGIFVGIMIVGMLQWFDQV
jgi:hypothetical protein